MTALDKQAELFIEINFEWDKSGRGYICREKGQLHTVQQVAAKFAAHRATQVREQTVAECLASLDGDTYPVMVLAAVNLMRKRIQAIAAPPETTEQEER